MKKTFRSLALAAIAAATFGFSGTAVAGPHCCPPAADLSSYVQVAGSTNAGPNQMSLAASHAENQGLAVVGPDAAIAVNHSEGSAIQFNGTATFEAGGYAGGEMAKYGCFDTVVGASTYSQVGGAAFGQHSVVDAEAGALATAGLDYTGISVETYADGISYAGVLGNGAAMAGYDAYASVDNG